MAQGESFAKGLSDILVKKKVITEQEGQDFQQEFEKSPKPYFDDYLLEEGLVIEDDLLEALSEYYQVGYFDVVGYFFDHALLTNFPKGFLLRHAVIPLTIDQNFLVMVASNPHEEGLIERINEFVPYEVEFYVGLRRDITDQIKEFYDLSITELELEEAAEEEQEAFEDIVKES